MSNSIGLDLRVSEGLKSEAEVGHSSSKAAGGTRPTVQHYYVVEPHNPHYHSMKWLVHVVAPLISVVIFTLLPPVKNAINTTRK